MSRRKQCKYKATGSAISQPVPEIMGKITTNRPKMIRDRLKRLKQRGADLDLAGRVASTR